MSKVNNLLFFDIETGGFESTGPRASSLLSISWERAGQGLATRYSRPVQGTWLSKFSSDVVLPQLVGKSTIPERESILSFIQELRSTEVSGLVGYNIESYDLPFLHGRASIYGLQKQFKEALHGKSILDVSYGVKDVISSAITTHAYRGTFDEALGEDFRSLLAKSRDAAPGQLGPAFNAIHQAVGYDTARMHGKVASSIQMQGWKLEDVYDILRRQGAAPSLTGLAHESSTDVIMTQRVLQAQQSGELQSIFRKPEVAKFWLQQTINRREETEKLLQAGGKSAGYFYRHQRTIPEIWRDLPINARAATVVGAALALTATGIALSKNKSNDDAHNDIEGLRHGGQAQQMRRALTPFGSGWRKEDDYSTGNFITDVTVIGGTLTAAPNVYSNLRLAAAYSRGYGVFYHGTPNSNAESILKEGLKPNASAWEELQKNLGSHGETLASPLQKMQIAQVKEKAHRVFFSMEPWVSRAHASAELAKLKGPYSANMAKAAGMFGYFHPDVRAGRGEGTIFKFMLPMSEVTPQSGIYEQIKAITNNHLISKAYSLYAETFSTVAAPSIDVSKTGRISPEYFTESIPAAGGEILWDQAKQLNTSLGKSFPRMWKQAGKRLAMAVTPLAALAAFVKYRLSGKDDAHNTIEGLRHGGQAQKLRKDFGSGWRGIVKIPLAVESALASVLHGAAFTGETKVFKEIASLGLNGLANKEDFIKALLNSKMTTSLTEAEQEYNVTLASFNYFQQEVLSAEKAGHKFIIGVGESASKTSSKELKALIRHERVHLGSAAKFGTPGGAPGTAPAGWTKFLTAINYNQGNKSSYYEEYLAYSYQSQVLGHKSIDPLRALLGDAIDDPIEQRGITSLIGEKYDPQPTAAAAAALAGKELEAIGWLTRKANIKSFKQESRERIKKWLIRLARPSAKDDDHNTIEGLQHGGLAQKLRKDKTPFGSGWDALRNLTKVGEKFEDMLQSKSFQKALMAAERGKELGKGGFGKVYEMTGKFRGQQFSFVRKVGQIGEDEVSTMQKFQNSFAPTVYGHGHVVDNFHYIDMERFEGQSLAQGIKSQTATYQAAEKFESALTEMNKAGLVHGDAHAANAILTPQGEVGIIDFGLSGHRGENFRILTAQGAEARAIKPGGEIGRIAVSRGLGVKGHGKGGVELGYFEKRESVLDEIAIEAMRKNIATYSRRPTVLTKPADSDFMFNTVAGRKLGPSAEQRAKRIAQAELARKAQGNAQRAGRKGGKIAKE